MSVNLSSLAEPAQTEPLREIARETVGEKTLAVCERAGGTYVLCIERMKPVADTDGKRPAKTETGQPREREPVLATTANLADFAAALQSGLVTLD